jgi:adenosylcobinamide kinase/adenosylcobinamide-phosphate guanylyltransferase
MADEMSKIYLVTGGARSGKSSYALELAESLADKRVFVATCPTIDQEMSERVRRHQEERQGRGWTTIETPLKLAELFGNQIKEFDLALVDCLTLWVNNLLFDSEKRNEELTDHKVKELCNEWIQRIRSLNITVICVTNEVGLGIVPENELARKYRDLVGTVNQTIGKVADQVTLVSCGIPLHIKS